MCQGLERLFQFHKGTIKTLQMAGLSPAAMEFQFHKGTIKTHIDMLDKSPCYRGFPNAKIRKKTGEICRCGIILK